MFKKKIYIFAAYGLQVDTRMKISKLKIYIYFFKEFKINSHFECIYYLPNIFNDPCNFKIVKHCNILYV